MTIPWVRIAHDRWRQRNQARRTRALWGAPYAVADLRCRFVSGGERNSPSSTAPSPPNVPPDSATAPGPMTRSACCARASTTQLFDRPRKDPRPQSCSPKSYKGAEGEYNFDQFGDGLHGYNIVRNEKGVVVFDKHIEFTY